MSDKEYSVSARGRANVRDAALRVGSPVALLLSVAHSSETPGTIKRQIVLVLLPVAAVSAAGAAVYGLVTQQSMAWASWIGLFVAAGLVVFTYAVVRWPASFERIERALVVFVVATMLVSIVFAGVSSNVAESSFELIRQAMWLPVVYAFAFLVLGPRAGGLVSWSLWAVLAFVASSHLFWPEGHAQLELVTLGEALVANGVTILIFSGVARVIRASERHAARMELAANTDALTAIANRRSGERLLEEEVERSHRYQRPLSVVLFDVDFFKYVNDSYGHAAGDRVLAEVPKVLSSRYRESDILVRWGGEEFLIVAPEMTLERAAAMAERLRSLVEDHDFGIGWALTASFGVAERRGEESAADVVRRADEAMYAAKRGGRNAVWRSVWTNGDAKVEVYTAGAPKRTSDRLQAVKAPEG